MRLQNIVDGKTDVYLDDGAALREEVDQALLELKKDGTLSEILTRYLGMDTSPKDEDMKETLN